MDFFVTSVLFAAQHETHGKLIAVVEKRGFSLLPPLQISRRVDSHFLAEEEAKESKEG